MSSEQVINNKNGYFGEFVVSRMYKRLLQVNTGSLIINIGNKTYSHASETPGLQADMTIHKPLAMARRCAMRGDLGFAESYMAGEWSSSNLDTLLQQLLRNDQSIKYSAMRNGMRRLGAKIFHRLKANSISGSRKNIAYHYDLGNSFYKTWLDASMTYSSALYKSGDMSLEQAQNAKNARILEQLNAVPGASVLEIGCGWGGFMQAAAEQGLHAHGVTLSEEQHSYAQQRLENLEPAPLVEIRDYRKVEQRFDHIVSIEMFEAVGEAWWPTYFSCLSKYLKPGGSAVLQVITIKEDLFEKYRKYPDFIQRYIFPGGMLPTKTAMDQLCSDANLEVTDRFCFGKDYGKTLEQWHQNFDAQSHQLDTKKYDQRFIQMWKYYLSYCRAGFNEGTIDVVQYTLHKAKDD